MNATQNPYGSCGDIARRHDPDRYLITMMMPKEFHADLLALVAFNHEIAKTREIVTETQLGLIRLQWWREAITEIYEGKSPRNHEVVEALARAIKSRGLSQNYFEALIYAREFDLEDVLPGDMDGLIHYADFTTTPLLALMLEVMGEGGVDSAAIQPVALNYALVNLMRAVSFHASYRRCYLPQDHLELSGQSINKLYQGKPDDALAGLIKDVLGACVFDLDIDHTLLGKHNRLALIYYKQLKSLNFDVFHPKMQAPPAFKPLRLLMG